MQSSFLLVSHYSRWEVQYCKLSHQTLKQFLFFQGVKLNSADNGATYFITDIRAEERLGEQSAEFSGLKREERFDFCEMYKKSFFRNNNTSGHKSTSGRETMFRYQTNVSSFNHQRSAVEGFRRSEPGFSCDVCKKTFTIRSDLEEHTGVHLRERPFSCEVCKKLFTRRSSLHKHLRVHTRERLFLVKCVRKSSLKAIA
jgi:hypothetical protein